MSSDVVLSAGGQGAAGVWAAFRRLTQLRALYSSHVLPPAAIVRMAGDNTVPEARSPAGERSGQVEGSQSGPAHGLLSPRRLLRSNPAAQKMLTPGVLYCTMNAPPVHQPVHIMCLQCLTC